MLRRLLKRWKTDYAKSRAGNRRGVAMVMAITTMALLTYLAMEVMYDSTVEYTVNAQALNRLKAYYAAKSGLEIGLLRVKIYQTVMNQTSAEQRGMMGDYIDQIWSFPFTWPLMIPDELNSVDKEAAQAATKDTLMDASYSLSIQDEGSKTDLGDLVSRSKVLQEIAQKRLLEIFEEKRENDEVWRRKHSNVRFEEIVNNIADWMSDKNSGRGGGDKRSGYDELNRESPNAYPPNRGFRTLQELRLVKDMNDDFYDLLAPRVTIYGMRGVHPNVATKEILMSLDRGITPEVADELIKRRTDEKLGGPYKDAKDFWGYAQTVGARLQNQEYEKIPLVFSKLTTFRIKSTGEFGGAVREVEAIVADLDSIGQEIKTAVDKEKKTEEGEEGAPGGPRDRGGRGGLGGGGGGSGGGGGKNPLPKGPPRIVYWTEK